MKPDKIILYDQALLRASMSFPPYAHPYFTAHFPILNTLWGLFLEDRGNGLWLHVPVYGSNKPIPEGILK